MAIAGTTDTVTLEWHITQSDHRIEFVTFADGAVWTHAELMTRATAPTAGADLFYAATTASNFGGR